jgi:hypothetical protein
VTEKKGKVVHGAGGLGHPISESGCPLRAQTATDLLDSSPLLPAVPMLPVPHNPTTTMIPWAQSCNSTDHKPPSLPGGGGGAPRGRPDAAGLWSVELHD